jgi:hypothetical protein
MVYVCSWFGHGLPGEFSENSIAFLMSGGGPDHLQVSSGISQSNDRAVPANVGRCCAAGNLSCLFPPNHPGNGTHDAESFM